MAGLLGAILTRRYGEPELAVRHNLRTRVWNSRSETDSSELYLGMKWVHRNLQKYGAYRTMYGDAFGGPLIGGALKVATLAGVRVYGTYQIEELQDHVNVRSALQMDPELRFFMDAANVWYYAVKGDELYCFDSELEELYERGPLEKEVTRLLAEWEEAGASQSLEKA